MTLMHTDKNHLYVVMGAFMIGMMALVTEATLFFNPDVASLLYDTQLFLSGGTYVKDFYETNPPMIFILYSPIVLMHAWTGCDLRLLADGYFVLLAFMSLFICFRILSQILSPTYDVLKYGLQCALIYGYLIFPVYDFGQREHLFLMLVMPYVFSMVVRTQQKVVMSLQATVIGLMAGVGFALKPFFLIPLVLLESYLMVKTRNIWAWVRLEALMILAILVFYLAFVLAFHPAYLDVMLPLISHWYFLGTKDPWLRVFSMPKVLFCFTMVMFSFFMPRKNDFPELMQVLTIALIGMIAVFLWPRSAWNYHLLPAYVFAILLCIMCFYLVCFVNQKNPWNKKSLFWISAAIFAMPLTIHALEVKRAVDAITFRPYKELMAKVKSLQVRSIYCYATTTSLCFPLVTLQHHAFAGRFPLFWWVRGMLVMQASNPHLPSYFFKEKNYFSKEIADDLNQYKPELIIIYSAEEKYFLPKGYTFPSYFSDNAAHREAWSHYRWLSEVGGYRLYYRYD